MNGLLRGAVVLVSIVVVYFGVTYGAWRYQSAACDDLSAEQHAALRKFIGQGQEVRSATRIETTDGLIIGAITGAPGDGSGPTYRVYRCVGAECEISLLESSFTPAEGEAGARAERCLMGWMR